MNVLLKPVGQEGHFELIRMVGVELPGVIPKVPFLTVRRLAYALLERPMSLSNTPRSNTVSERLTGEVGGFKAYLIGDASISESQMRAALMALPRKYRREVYAWVEASVKQFVVGSADALHWVRARPNHSDQEKRDEADLEGGLQTRWNTPPLFSGPHVTLPGVAFWHLTLLLNL